MRQPDDYNPTPFFKERRSRSGLQTSRFGGRREREPVRQSPPCYMQVIHAGPARRDFFQKLHTSAMGNPWPLFLIRNAEFGIRNCGRGLIRRQAITIIREKNEPQWKPDSCLPSAPGRSLIDATGDGFWMQFVVADNLAAMELFRCSPGRRNADATLASPKVGKLSRANQRCGKAETYSARD